MQKYFKFIRITSKIVIFFMVLAFVSILSLYLYLEPKLPSIVAEYGEKRRSPKSIDEIPLELRQAFLAAEDDRFYEHPGVDYQGILRAVMVLATTGKRGQGGSTITMQLARNFYLSREKTFARKLNEIFLALNIEQKLTKNQILELYLNKIYLGNRAYGVSAAARVYYGKPMSELNLAQLAMIAGLPKAPSRYNPIANPGRALIRRNYVLKRMFVLGHITESEMRLAKAQPATAGLHDSTVDVSASYVAEMVRAEISKQFGENAYTDGLKVYTTINSRLQKAANKSLRHALRAYDRRHGYRGALQHIDLSATNDDLTLDDSEDIWREAVEDLSIVADLHPALVLEVSEQSARVYLRGGRLINLSWEGLKWARPFVDRNKQGAKPTRADEILSTGDIIRIYKKEGEWVLGQIPEVQGALTSVRSNDGALQALVGGYDFHYSKFNRAIQAKRQAGSSFKPFIYSAALSRDYTAATLINDAPVVFHDPALEGTWRPENYSGKFFGPTRLRVALFKSRNLVSIRILRAIGVRYATQFAEKYGFDSKLLPHDLSLALGSGEVSPLQLSEGYSVFSNGGYKVKPYFIEKIEDINGNILFEADPDVACVSCKLEAQGNMISDQQSQMDDKAVREEGDNENISAENIENATANGLYDNDEMELPGLNYKLPRQAGKAVDPRIIYIMNSILKDVIVRGTGRRARVLQRSDLHGKTGTTNDQKDAWFNGFNHELVATVWVGFDQQQRSLGNYETGSKAALPMWIEFMKTALKGKPETEMERPEGLVNVKINAETGELANANDKNVVFEVFREELAPRKVAPGRSPVDTDNPGDIPEQLF